MRKFIKIILLLIVVATVIAVALQAQTLPVDSRKKEMQFNRDFSTYRHAVADTVWRKITIPERSVEMLVLADTRAFSISADSTYASTNTNYFRLDLGVPLKLPCIRLDHIWVRRTAADSTATAQIIFYKM